MATGLRLFLDASVLIAAAASPQGGSALVLEVCKAGRATPLVSRLVLREAERNILDKLGEEVILRFYRIIVELEPQVIAVLADNDIEAAAAVVSAKDAHVLAAARNGEATHLITLDRKHFLRQRQRQAMLPILACTPGEFLQRFSED